MAQEDFERILEARNFGGDVDRVWNLVDLLAQLLTMLHQDEVETWCNLQRDTGFSLKWPAPPVLVDNMIHRPCFSAGFPHPLWKLLGDSEKIDHDLCEVILKLNAVWSQVRDEGLPHLSHSTFFHDIRCQIKEANVPEQPIFSECHDCLRKRCASEKWSAIDGSVPCRHPCARPGSSVRT